ncbi:MAG: ribbon-helix-helix protein, CopG family [Acidobacteria bacterium]|nr:ribbon-helix-helix protein, CopG family [Acidobacteriota bacterium]
MAVLRPRRRLVFFRIPEDDYERFRGLCEQEGARSVSELARTAVERFISRRETSEERLSDLCRLLNQVTVELREVVREAQAAEENDPCCEVGACSLPE